MLFSKVMTFEEKFRLICRAHSFQRLAEFRAEPRNLGFSAVLSRGILFSAVLTFFIRTTISFTENDLKVALLQVCL